MVTTPWHTSQWFVSPWNYLPEVASTFRFPEKIEIHDLTLRDGEQQAGILFRKEEKVRLAAALAELGVHRIEAGTPAVSREDESAVREIVRQKFGPKIFALARCIVEDVKRVADCGVDGAIVEIPCSEHMLQYAYQWPLEKAIEMSIAATRCAHEEGLYVVFFPIDSTRSDIEWYLTLIERVASEGWMDALALVDTSGVLSAHAVPLMVRRAQERTHKPLELHFHNDFGHSVVNTIAGLAAGASVAHLTMNGIGERAGNTPLEETVLSLLVQYGVDVGLHYDKLFPTAQLVRQLGGFPMADNRPVTGDRLFHVESGIITDWWRNCGEEHILEIFPYHWDLVGQPDPRIVYGKLSGTASVHFALERRGISASDSEISDILLRIKQRAVEKKDELSEADLDGIIDQVLSNQKINTRSKAVITEQPQEHYKTADSQHPVVHRSWKRPRPVIDHGEGIYLYDKEGKRYIDGSSGTSVVVNVGHGVQSIIDAWYEQAEKVAFASPHYFTNEPMLKLGQIIRERAPGAMRNNCRTWFSCTGTDSVDDSCRLARQYSIANGAPSKYVIISRWQQFHGNQIGMAGVAGHTARRRMLYPMFVNSPHIPPAYCYRCYFGDTYPDCNLKCARALETEIRQIGEENVAAFIAEPVVGASLGALPAPEGYFDVIREICDRYNVLLMVDEVMTAWGRVGSWFAMDDYGITPDVIATSKGLTAGYVPVAATIAREEIWQVIENSGVPFMAGHTVTESPAACAAAVATLTYVEEHNLIANSKETGGYLLERLGELRELDIVGDVRGRGLMCGIELVMNKETKEPFPPEKKACLSVFTEGVKRGLILFPCTGNVEGVAGDMLLVTPPLITTRDQVDEIVAITEEAIKSAQVQLLS